MAENDISHFRPLQQLSQDAFECIPIFTIKLTLWQDNLTGISARILCPAGDFGTRRVFGHDGKPEVLLPIEVGGHTRTKPR